MKTLSDVANAITKVMHPAINYPLTELGIVTDIELEDNKVTLVFAFPFPNIPIADQLINSIEQPIKELGLEMEHSIRIMSVEEKVTFLQLETAGWKGK
ncbi:MAG: metal-sulfur cluster biosynthetic enzyme [Bacteroidetes bacterium]|nr:MAG: metal-sulfur cluster biosynthetic enzyme [Bacteroidota bacterium]